MTRKTLQSLILKRMDELERLYAWEIPDTEQILANAMALAEAPALSSTAGVAAFGNNPPHAGFRHRTIS